MPFVPSNAAGYLKDMDGEGRTAQMVQSGIVFPARDWVVGSGGDIQSPFNSETLKAFMTSSGQLYQLQINKNDINEIARIVLNKGSDYNFALFGGSWWSASQSTATYALNLVNGSMAYYNKTSTYCNVARFYEFA